MSLYDLPDRQELEFLIGCEITQVSLGRYQLILNLHKQELLPVSVSISVESSMTISKDAVLQSWQPDSTFLASLLFEFWDQQITEYDYLPNNELSLTFGQYGAMVVRAKDDGYESYNVSYFDGVNNHLWVV